MSLQPMSSLIFHLPSPPLERTPGLPGCRPARQLLPAVGAAAAGGAARERPHLHQAGVLPPHLLCRAGPAPLRGEQAAGAGTRDDLIYVLLNLLFLCRTTTPPRRWTTSAISCRPAARSSARPPSSCPFTRCPTCQSRRSTLHLRQFSPYDADLHTAPPHLILHAR